MPVMRPDRTNSVCGACLYGLRSMLARSAEHASTEEGPCKHLPFLLPTGKNLMEVSAELE